MGEPNNSNLPLKNVFDLKKEVLFTLNVFQESFEWVVFFLSFFLYICIGNKGFIVFCVFIIML